MYQYRPILLLLTNVITNKTDDVIVCRVNIGSDTIALEHYNIYKQLLLIELNKRPSYAEVPLKAYLCSTIVLHP